MLNHVVLILSLFLLVGCSGSNKADSLVGALNSTTPSENNSPLVFKSLINRNVPAGTAMGEISPEVTDPQDLTLSFHCAFDNTVDASVGESAADCGALQNLDGSKVSYSTTSGVFNWTPPLASANSYYEFKITATNGKVSASQIFVVHVLNPLPAIATSLVTLGASTIASGNTTSVLFQGKDSTGANLTTGGATILFSTEGGTSTATFSAVTDNNDGTYSATVNGAGAGSASHIQASINGTLVTTVTPTITVTIGSLNLAQTLTSVSASTVVAGNSINVILQAKDIGGNSLTTGGQTIVFTKSGGTSTGTFSATTDHGNGTYSAIFTGFGAGTPSSMLATIGGMNVTSTLPTIQVLPGSYSLMQSILSVSGGTVLSSSSVNLILQIKDSYGNNLTAGGRTVSFSATGGTSTGTLSAVTDNGDGTYSATFTGLLAGTATTLHASIDGSAVTSTAPTLQVLSSLISAANSSITVSSASVASGSSITVVLQAKDNNNNEITSGGATIIFNQSGGTSTGTFGSVTDNLNGTYSANFTGNLAGTAKNIGATINGVTVTTVLPTVTVTAGSISVTQSLITLSASTVTSGSNIVMTLQAKDSSGNLISLGGGSISFGRSGGSSTGNIGTTTDNGNGTYTANFTGVLAGTATTITATIGGVAVTSTLPSVQVTVGAISTTGSTVTLTANSVASGNSVTVTVHAKDLNGNSLTSGGAIVGISNSGGTSTGNFSSTTDNGDGTYTKNFTGITSGTPTSIITLINAAAAIASPTVQVIPGPASLVTSTVTVAATMVLSGANVIATLHARDAHSNNLTSGGLVVAFANSGGTSTGNFSTVTDNLDGTYSINFQGQIAGTPTYVTATISGNLLTSTEPSLQVLPGAISLATSMISSTATTVSSGSTITISLQAKDANGNNLTTGGRTVIFSNSGGTSTGSYTSVTDSANGTYSTVLTGITAGSATNLTATIDGSPVTNTPAPQLTVTPGNPAGLSFNVQPSSSTTPLNAFPVQPVVNLIDANNNIIATGPNSANPLVMSLTTISGSGTLGGTTSMTTVSGIANFSGKGLYISGVGTYKLNASATALSLSALSSTITITASTPTITSNRALTIAYKTTATGAAALTTSLITTVTGSGSSATVSIITPVSKTMASTDAGVPAPSNNPAKFSNWTDQSTPTFTISVSGSNTSSCTSLSPFSAVACVASSFSLNFSDIYNAVTSVAGGTNFFQINDGYVSSNKLTVNKFLIDQISKNRAAANDVTETIATTGRVFYNNDVYFPGLDINNKTKLFKISSSGVYSQVTNLFAGADEHIIFLAAFNSALYFVASPDNGTNYFVYKLSGTTITQITNASAWPTIWDGNGPYRAYTVSGSRFYLMQKNTNGVYKVHYIDTSDNVVQFGDFSGSSVTDSGTSGYDYWFVFNGWMYFDANCASTTYCPATGNKKMRISDAGVLQQLPNFPGTLNPVIFNNKLYFTQIICCGNNASFYSLDTSDNLKNLVNSPNNIAYQTGFTPFNQRDLVPMSMGTKLYGACDNQNQKSKVCSYDTSTGVVNVIADTSGYSTLNDNPMGIGALTQSGVTTEIYFVSYAQANFSKLFRIDTSENVSQVSDLVPSTNDFSTSGILPFGPWGFQLPTGPSGINEMYFSGYSGVYGTNYARIFKIYPAP